MSTTIHIFVPEPPTERPITLEFQWEGTPTFSYGLTVGQAQHLVGDLLSALNMLGGVVQPVIGQGAHRAIAHARPIEVLDIEPAVEGPSCRHPDRCQGLSHCKEEYACDD